MKILKHIPWLLFLLFPAACSDDQETAPEDNPGPDTEEPTASYRDGINKIDDNTLAFVLFAPGKKEVHLIGDFNDWQVSDACKMKKEGDRFQLTVKGLEKGKEYVCQYLIDGKIRVADPYADQISDPWSDKAISPAVYPGLIAYPAAKTSEIAMVVSTGNTSYPWSVPNFRPNNPTDLVIYEILLRDFTTAGSVNAAREKIPYLKELGITAVELMPFNEFDGNDSWGYNPTFYFAPDKAYGKAADYKAFIDECHKNGIAVIMDMVLNHSWGQSPLVRMYQIADGQPAADNPWYNRKSNFANPDAQWGCDFNHESKYTQQLVDSICSYWMSQYKIDGFRFDFTKGFSNTSYPASGNDSWGNPYDAARIGNLKRMYDGIKKRNPDAIVIFEHLSDNREEKELADYGIWLWGNINYNFNEATMGYNQNSDVSWASYRKREWNKPNIVAYMESHDEERILFKNQKWGAQSEDGSYRVTALPTALKRTEAAAVLLMAFPGPKMIWQFGELGYDYELNDDRLARKPVRWDYYDVAERKNLYATFASINKLRNNHPAFSSDNYTIDVTGAYKQILLTSAAGDACVIANFGLTTASATVTFSKTGSWKEYFSGSSFIVDQTAMQIRLNPGEYRVYLSD